MMSSILLSAQLVINIINTSNDNNNNNNDNNNNNNNNNLNDNSMVMTSVMNTNMNTVLPAIGRRRLREMFRSRSKRMAKEVVILI